MSETTVISTREDPTQNNEWSQQYTGNLPVVPYEARHTVSPEQDLQALRQTVDQSVRNAYINLGSKPESYGNKVNKVGACMPTSAEVVKSLHREGIHATYVESESRRHAYVIIPRSVEEVDMLESGIVPEDPLILDPTYAQFLDPYSGTQAPFDGMNSLDWESDISEGVAQVQIGLANGLHTEESPYYIGPASVLNSMFHIALPDQPGREPIVAPWDSAVIVPPRT